MKNKKFLVLTLIVSAVATHGLFAEPAPGPTGPQPSGTTYVCSVSYGYEGMSTIYCPPQNGNPKEVVCDVTYESPMTADFSCNNGVLGKLTNGYNLWWNNNVTCSATEEVWDCTNHSQVGITNETMTIKGGLPPFYVQ